DGTAANRLLLHVAPAIVFLLGIGLARLQLHQDSAADRRSPWRPSFAAAIAAVIVAVGAHFWLSNQADSTESTVRNFNGKDLRAVMGSASLVNGEAQVTEYENGAAILSTGRT